METDSDQLFGLIRYFGGWKILQFMTKKCLV